MAFLTHRPCLWPLILFLCSTPVTSFRPIITTGPTTFWVDQTCIQKGFTPVAAQESLDMSFLGSRRLLNLNDQYQAWVYNLLFKQPRDFQLENDEFSNAWDVVEVEGWIGAMKYEVNRDIADVRIYCDNDARWRPVPDDPVAIARGMTPNSHRLPGDDQEFEDPINFMRRDTGYQGCQGYMSLGVTYSTEYPDGTPGVPTDYHSSRQTITICDLAFRSPLMRFAQIPFQAWRFIKMNSLRLIPTNVLLYQLLALDPYVVRNNGDATVDTRDTWAYMLGQSADNLLWKPAPYSWNAVLAYAASKGWGLQEDLTTPQYVAGEALFRYRSALLNVPFIRGGPITLPNWVILPNAITAPGTD